MTRSQSIKNRMLADGHRYWANDNVSEYIEKDDIEVLIDEATVHFEAALESLLIDTKSDPNSKGTAKRLAKMYYNEIFEGRYFAPPTVTAFPNDGDDSYPGMITIRAEIKSVCSHHHQPVEGIAYIGIIPGPNKLLGLSKYIRLAQHHARRGTLQEELTQRIAKVIAEACETEDVAVYIKATHGCCQNRGVNAFNSSTQTAVLLGGFKTPENREEFYNNIKLQES